MARRTPVGTSGTGRRGISTLGWALRGAAAGAAGSTALNAVTYLDMAGRGRGSSSTPEQTVQALAGLGCDVLQGYHLARPMDAAATTAWLARRPDGPSVQGERADDRVTAPG